MRNNFIKFIGPDITGSSVLKGYEGWIEVDTWGFGGQQPTPAYGGTKKLAKLSPLTFTKEADRASDDLLKHLWSGGPISKVELHCRRSTGETNSILGLHLTLEQVIVAGYELTARPGESPAETIQLNYAKITYRYTETGQVFEVISYDLAQNVIA